jgi:hypothetical protein
MKISEILGEGKTGPGLWANIHAKQERIKSGSGEKMRKPGSKGAPTAANFKAAANEGALNEYAADGGSDDKFLKFARMWYQGDDNVKQKVEQALDSIGWEIGPLESEEGGCFVVQAGDEDGDTYIGFTPQELSEGIAEGSVLNRVRDELGDQGYLGTQDDRKNERQKHREYMDRLHQSRMHQQDRHQRSDDAYTDSQVAYWNAKADQYKQGPVHGGLPGTGSDPVIDKAMNMFIDRMNRYQYKTQRDVDPEQLEKISNIKYKDEVDEGNAFLQQHGIGAHDGKFPEPRKPRPDGIMSKSEVLGKDGLVYHWQDPRAKQDVDQKVTEAKKANTKTARAEFGKRPRAELSDKEKEQQKSESDRLWDMLQQHIAQAEKEKKPTNEGMLEETYHDDDEFYEAYGDLWYDEEMLNEAEYQGRKVQLGKPMQGDVAKFKVYVKDPSTGNVKKVNFGQKGAKIKKSNPGRRKNFRARHNCDNPGPRTKARYWSCRKW